MPVRSSSELARRGRVGPQQLALQRSWLCRMGAAAYLLMPGDSGLAPAFAQPLDVPASDAVAPATREAPRWPDGRPNLGAPPGEAGMWVGFGSRPMLFEFDVAPEGSIIVHDDPADLPADRFPKPRYSDVPFQPWARALFEHRARNRMEPYTRCKASAGPRFVATAYGTQFVEQPELGRMYIFPTGGPRTYRTIHMDGRSHPENPGPTYLGHSIGRWEGDTLVVETVGLNEKMWIDAEGSPTTDLLRLTERFTRIDFGTLRYDVTIDDPGAYTDVWRSGFFMSWEPDETFEFVCQDYNLAPELMIGSDHAGVDRSLPYVP
jgi:hypothetical protein